MPSKMSVTSPTSASPSTSLLEWDEAAVQSYLGHIGLPQYEDVIIGAFNKVNAALKAKYTGSQGGVDFEWAWPGKFH